MWPLHCHIVIHVSAELLVNVMVSLTLESVDLEMGRWVWRRGLMAEQERPGLIQSQRKIPGDATQLCEKWGKFTDTNIVDQIDSGLKI